MYPRVLLGKISDKADIINYLKQPKFVFDVDSRTKQKLFVTHKYVGSSLPDMALKTGAFYCCLKKNRQ